MKIYLGGTYFSDWRNRFIKALRKNKTAYFNPVRAKNIQGMTKITDEMVQQDIKEISECNVFLNVFVPSKGFYLYPDMIALQNVLTMVEEAKRYVCIYYICTKYKGKKFSENQLNILTSPVQFLQDRGVLCFTGENFMEDTKKLLEFMSTIKEQNVDLVNNAAIGQALERNVDLPLDGVLGTAIDVNSHNEANDEMADNALKEGNEDGDSGANQAES